jgi:hypothetical protein
MSGGAGPVGSTWKFTETTDGPTIAVTFTLQAITLENPTVTFTADNGGTATGTAQRSDTGSFVTVPIPGGIQASAVAMQVAEKSAFATYSSLLNTTSDTAQTTLLVGDAF